MGPFDGHDVTALRDATCEAALDADRPVVVHIHTVKGKGFEPAEEGGLEGMEKWHAAKPGSIVEGKPAPKKPAAEAAADPRRDGRGRPPGGGREAAARIHGGVRRRARGRGQARPAGDRDHRGDGGGDRADRAREGVPGAVLRRRHRRAGRGPVRRRARDPGREAGLRDLLDLPPARLRPDRPRRLPAEAQRRLRDGPRRARRRRRPDPPRRLRHLLPPLAAERRRDGAARRGDALPHAAHRARPRRRPDRLPLPARHRRGRAAARPRPRDPDRHRRGAEGGGAGGPARLRLRRAGRARRRGAARRARPRPSPSPTPASPSRSTRS